MDGNLYLIEFYTKHPETKESGWDIHFAWVRASKFYAARMQVSKIENFDDIIDIEIHSKISKLDVLNDEVVHDLTK